jgi:hypothetical protein
LSIREGEGNNPHIIHKQQKFNPLAQELKKTLTKNSSLFKQVDKEL